MNANMKLYVEKLRTTSIRQGVSKLCWDGRYCAFGLACLVFNEDNVIPLKVELVNPKDGFGSFDGHTGTPPMRLRKWLQLPLNLQHKIMNWNDSDRKSFKEIADEIERYYADPTCDHSVPNYVLDSQQIA